MRNVSEVMFTQEAVPVAMTKAQMTKQEKEWRAQDDARILADSEVIKADATRLKDAKSAAAKLADEERDKASAMGRIARMRKTRLPSEGREESKPKARKVKPKNVHNVFNRI